MLSNLPELHGTLPIMDAQFLATMLSNLLSAPYDRVRYGMAKFLAIVLSNLPELHGTLAITGRSVISYRVV